MLLDAARCLTPRRRVGVQAIVQRLPAGATWTGDKEGCGRAWVWTGRGRMGVVLAALRFTPRLMAMKQGASQDVRQVGADRWRGRRRSGGSGSRGKGERQSALSHEHDGRVSCDWLSDGQANRCSVARPGLSLVAPAAMGGIRRGGINELIGRVCGHVGRRAKGRRGERTVIMMCMLATLCAKVGACTGNGASGALDGRGRAAALCVAGEQRTGKQPRRRRVALTTGQDTARPRRSGLAGGGAAAARLCLNPRLTPSPRPSQHGRLRRVVRFPIGNA